MGATHTACRPRTQYGARRRHTRPGVGGLHRPCQYRRDTCDLIATPADLRDRGAITDADLQPGKERSSTKQPDRRARPDRNLTSGEGEMYRLAALKITYNSEDQE
jgi:hypothetical protein